MQVQFNEKFKPSKDTVTTGKGLIMITPEIGEDYWVFRVPLAKDQAVVAFPKFHTMGIGFQLEDNWNTNLPYTCSPEEIRRHIWENRRYKQITRKQVEEAIALLQPHCERYLKGGKGN